MAQKSEVSCGNGIVRLHCAPFFQNTLQKLLSQWFCQEPMSLRHLPMRIENACRRLTPSRHIQRPCLFNEGAQLRQCLSAQTLLPKVAISCQALQSWVSSQL